MLVALTETQVHVAAAVFQVSPGWLCFGLPAPGERAVRLGLFWMALRSGAAVAPSGNAMTSQGTAHSRFQRAIHRRNVQAAEMAAREMGGLSLADALSLCELLANVDPARYERAALRWLRRFIDERVPPLTEVALAAAALAELRHGRRNVGVEALKRLLRRG